MHDVQHAPEKAALDANALIQGLEKGERAAIDRALAGCIPLVSRTAAKEFLAKGDANVLREFLRARDGGIGRAATAEQIANLQAQARAFGRVLRLSDAAVVGSALTEEALIITRDIRLLKFLRAAGIPARSF